MRSRVINNPSTWSWGDLLPGDLLVGNESVIYDYSFVMAIRKYDHERYEVTLLRPEGTVGVIHVTNTVGRER